MNIYLGIDGGGTKTKFVLADGGGRILAESTQPTCHYLQCGFDGVTRVLSDGLAAVCGSAGVAPEAIRGAFLGCPGFGEVPEAIPRMRASAAAALSGVPHRVGNDCENALAGALGGKPGINIVAGTGSIGFGKNAAGKTMRCGGWYHAIGSDEGSGYWISVRLLTEFTRQSDGRDEKTALYPAVRETLGLDCDFDVIQRVVTDWALDRTRVASLSPLCSKLFDAGDPHARRILEDAAKELCDIVCAIHRGLGFSGDVPVGCTGGVFRMGERILAPMRAILAPCGMQLVSPLLPPDRGALILAMQDAGQPPAPDALERLAEGC